MKKWYESQETVYLECRIEGLPKPNRTWYLGYKEINKSEMSSVYEIELETNELSIKSFDKSLQGAYICNGTNEFGSVIFVHNLELAGMGHFYQKLLFYSTWISSIHFLSSLRTTCTDLESRKTLDKCQNFARRSNSLWIRRWQTEIGGSLVFQRPRDQRAKSCKIFDERKAACNQKCFLLWQRSLFVWNIERFSSNTIVELYTLSDR